MSLEEKLLEQIRLKDDGHLFHREGQTLEFKEQFNWAGVADYYRDFAAFSNNKGGMIVFGVSDVPRELVGLSREAIDAFKKIDPEKISGHLLENFSGHIEWEHCLIEHRKKLFACFAIQCATVKPIIAKKDAGRGTVLKNGEIYFRYGGRTQKINYPELEAIINSRIRRNNLDWIEKVSQIGSSGPENTAVLDIAKRKLSFGETKEIYVDAKLIQDVNLVKEGQFSETEGGKTLKLTGSVTPVDTIEVVKEVIEDKLAKYTLSAEQLALRIKQKQHDCSKNKVWKIIAEEGIKFNAEYSCFNFRKASDLERYDLTGRVRKGTPSIYSESAIDHIVNIFQNSD